MNHITSAARRNRPALTFVEDPDTGRLWPLPAGGADDEDDDPDADDDDLDDWKRNARKWERRAKANQDAAEELEQLKAQDKSEVDQLRDERDAALQRADDAEAARLKLTVALDSAPEGMPLSKVRNLADRLRGDGEDELADDAEALFADFAPSKDEDGDGDQDDVDGDPAGDGGDPKGTPKPKLKPGEGGDGGGGTESEDDIAARIMQRAGR